MVPSAIATFSEKTAARVVADRLLRQDGGRLARFLAAFVGHVHEAIRETRPTQTDWRLAIEFLTEVGHACDEKRQEWILLSDLLGVSSLVEEINGRRPEGATPGTLRGPFYRPDAPLLPLGADLSLDGMGEPLSVSGRVVDLDGNPVTGASVETWQANADGVYENQQPDVQPEFNLRGRFATDAAGSFRYRTVRPGGYGVPQDGPAGALLARIGCPLRRPAHLHFQIAAPGFETLVTHLYDRSDPAIGADPLYGVKPSLLVDLLPAGGTGRSPSWTLDFRFVLARAATGRSGS